MRIINLNTQLTSESGTMPYRMHKQFLSQGYDSYFVTVDALITGQNLIRVKMPFAHQKIAISRFIRKMIFGRLLGYDKYFYYPEWNLHGATAKKILLSVPQKPDMIIAYWVDYYFNQKVLFDLSQITGVPVLWYLMDMAPLTGGCHMAYDCKGYETDCSKCSALRYSFTDVISSSGYERKSKYIEKTPLATISASTFLYHQVKSCSLFKNKPNYQVMLPVEENIFKPGDKKAIRNVLGLPKESKIIFFGAASIDVENKGIKYLIEALNILAGKLDPDPTFKSKILVLLAGKGGMGLNLPFKCINLGHLDSQEKIAQAYQAADLFVCSSIQDSGPMMINEAIMSGTPVVSFEMGVAADLVHTEQTGYRAKLADSNDLAKGLEYVINLNEQEWQGMSQQCRQLGLACCTPRKQIEKVIKIAESMIQICDLK